MAIPVLWPEPCRKWVEWTEVPPTWSWESDIPPTHLKLWFSNERLDFCDFLNKRLKGLTMQINFHSLRWSYFKWQSYTHETLHLFPITKYIVFVCFNLKPCQFNISFACCSHALYSECTPEACRSYTKGWSNSTWLLGYRQIAPILSKTHRVYI